MTSLLAVACGGEREALVPVHDRLWLTSVPKSIKDDVGAFIVIRASEKRQYGFLFKGTLLRGYYDTFHWAPEGEGRATMRTIQDDKSHKIRTEACDPDTGFQYCVQLHGDPTGVVRYQSRKRWGIGRPKKIKLLGFDLATELRELAAEDGELAQALAQIEAEAELPTDETR